MKSREMQNFWRHTYDFFADSSKSTTISQLCALFVDEQNCWTRQLNTAVLQLLFLADGLSYRGVRCPPETASTKTDEIDVVVTAAPEFRTSFLFTNDPLFRAL